MTDNNVTTADVQATARPPSVRLAILGLLVVAGAALIQGVNAAIERAVYASGLDEASKIVNHEQIIFLTGNFRGSLVLAAGLGLAGAVAFVGLAALLNRRLRPARALAAIVCGLVVIGEIILMAADSSSIKTGNFIRQADVPGGDLGVVETVNRMLVSGWFVPVYYLTEFAVLAATVFVVIQLFRNSTAEYFHAGREHVVGVEHTWSVEQVKRSEELGT